MEAYRSCDRGVNIMIPDYALAIEMEKRLKDYFNLNMTPKYIADAIRESDPFVNLLKSRTPMWFWNVDERAEPTR